MSTSLPRPLLMALLGAVAVGALFMFTRSGGEEETAAPPVTPPAETSTAPAKPAAPPSSAKSAAGAQAKVSEELTLPAPVKKALDANKVVVVLFWSPRGVDDKSVKQSVDGLSTHGGKVAVFKDNLENFPRYATITAPAKVVQTPTLVVADSKNEARVATGYLDSATVEQYVVDALHGAP